MRPDHPYPPGSTEVGTGPFQFGCSLRPRARRLGSSNECSEFVVLGVVRDRLRTMNEQVGLSRPFISHDPAVVRRACDRVEVVRRGDLVEFDVTVDPETVGVVPSFRASSSRTCRTAPGPHPGNPW